MTTETTIQTLAADTRAHFVQKTRPDGTTFYSFDHEASPAWLIDVVREIHGEMMPDDHKYRFVVEALDALAECDEPDEADVEADSYTSELCAWLGSHGDRPSYCDEALEEFGGGFNGTTQLLAWGQYREKREVLDGIRSALTALLPTPDESD